MANGVTPWVMMQLQKMFPGEDGPSELHATSRPPIAPPRVKSMVDGKPAIMSQGEDPSLQEMDSTSNNMPAATTPQQTANPEGDAYQGPHPEPTISDPKVTTRDLGSFQVNNMDDLQKLRAAKTREELEEIKQQILNHGGGYTPPPVITPPGQ